MLNLSARKTWPPAQAMAVGRKWGEGQFTCMSSTGASGAKASEEATWTTRDQPKMLSHARAAIACTKPDEVLSISRFVLMSSLLRCSRFTSSASGSCLTCPLSSGSSAACAKPPPAEGPSESMEDALWQSELQAEAEAASGTSPFFSSVQRMQGLPGSRARPPPSSTSPPGAVAGAAECLEPGSRRKPRPGQPHLKALMENISARHTWDM
mmetsp:Transcript_37618/g.108425  ORF Transcript_37618/g.108425 Transcript_37618/m.108425 type:complete len:210 (+) Transcript_37618:142-771(+)